MTNVMEMVEVYDLPINSLGAIQTYNERARAGMYDYGVVLRSLVGESHTELEDPEHARVQVGYIFQLAIEANIAGEKIDPDQLYVDATAKAKEFIRELSWVFAKKEVTTNLDEDGKPKAKKGSKAVRTYQVYCDLINSNTTRKDIIAAFQDETVMSPSAPHTKSGATTYYYNMKKKYEADNS